eukprot:TRINITY_DN239_c0_g1_i1.p1 TRINITY_DN239_c0_g1~~TRINITY_DN239_c0_g1_i1.p1  ORF type:complete len:121 (-),score=43.42 TRINITY_DN239_c0_g1_i1:193-522(-)
MGGGHSHHSALQRIDQQHGGALNYVDKLFTQYDRDRSGVLEGHEYQSLINDVTDFMVEDFRRQGHHYDRHVVHGWVQHSLDPNRDGRITRRELENNLKRVLDEGEGSRW